MLLGRGLANGTPVFYRSLTFHNDCFPEEIKKKIARSFPGQVVDVPAPAAVNVRLDVTDQDRDAWIQSTQPSLVPEEIVIPVLLDDKFPRSLRFASTRIYFHCHEVEPAFCVTFHKIQGRTVEKLILDLNRPTSRQLGRISFAYFYVGISRVRRCADLRLLTPQPWSSFSHLHYLPADPTLGAWLNCYDAQGIFSSSNNMNERKR